MSPGQTNPTKPYIPTFGLTLGESIWAEWVRIIGIVIGVGAMPLLKLVNEKIMNLFWVLPLAGGGLVLCTGLYLAWRQARKGEDSNPAYDSSRSLPAGKGLVLPWQLSVQMSLSTTEPFYKQPEVNLLLDCISLAREQVVAEAIAEKLSPERLLTWQQSGQLAKLHNFLAELNQRLSGPHPSAAKFVDWMVKRLDNYDLVYLQDDQTGAIQKFINFLESIDFVDIDPSDLPEQLAWLERLLLNRLLLEDYVHLARDYQLPLTKDSGNWLLAVAGQLLGQFSLKVLQPSIEAAMASKLSPERWLGNTRRISPAGLNQDQTEELARLHDHLAKLNKQLTESGKSAEEFVEEIQNGLKCLGYVPLKTSTTASTSSGSDLGAPVLSLLSVPNLLISLGLLILLPGCVALIALAGGFAYAQRIAWFFSAPAILIWMVTEGASVFFAWRTRPQQPWQSAMMVKSILHGTGAALILVYLALSYSQLLQPVEGQNTYPVWTNWLLVAGGGLAMFGAVLASRVAFVQSSARSEEKSPSPPVPASRGKVFCRNPSSPDEASRKSAELKRGGLDAPAEQSEGKERVS